MLKIFYGRESVNKEKFIYEAIKDSENESIVIVPGQYTLEAEKQAFNYLETEGLVNLEIISLPRLGMRLLKEQGEDRSKTFVNKYGRHMLLSKIGKEKEDQLTVFKGSAKKNFFIQLINDLISEMKQYNSTSDALKLMLENTEEDSLIHNKLSDVYTIVKEYEACLEGKYTDSEDYIDLYTSKIATSTWLENKEIWVYGYDSFAPKALDILGELMGKCEDVNVVLTCDDPNDGEDVFSISRFVIKRLEKQAEDRGIKTCCTPVDEKYLITGKAAGISAIEEAFFTDEQKTFTDSKGVVLVEAANIYTEAESAASHILYLLREKGYRYKDIALICNDQEVRGSVIKRIFEEYNINVFDDKKRSILSSPVAIYVMSLLEIVTGKYSTKSIFKLLKTGFSNVSYEEIERLENYATKYRIRGTMWKKPFIKGQFEYGEEGLNEIEFIREKAIEPIEKFEEIYKNSESIDSFIIGFYQYLSEKTDFIKKIKELIDIQREQGFSDEAMETAQVWNMLVNLFDQIREISGEGDFDGKEFMELLYAGLSELTVGVLPPTSDDILMGTMERSRYSNVKAVLIIGANEGVLPAEVTDQGLFTMDEVELLEEKGTEFCKTEKVREMEEDIAIYRNMSRPTEDLYISYALNDGEGNEQKPSTIVSRLHEIFPELKTCKDVINSEDEIARIGGRINTLRHLSEELQKVKKGEKISGVWETVYDWFQENDEENLSKVEKGLAFTNKQKNLGRDAAAEMIGKGNPDKLKVSPSQLEKYSRCPFSHFIMYGLKPDENRPFEAGPREIGDVYHECLMKLALKLTADDSWLTINEEECKALTDEIIDQTTASYREGVFSYNYEEEYKLKRLKTNFYCVAKAMIDQVRAGKIEKAMFEIPFGERRPIPPVEVTAGDKTVSIEGKIDRLDILKGDRVKIIDYKTGSESLKLREVKGGYRLQLMLYLKAAQEEEKKPAGVFYFLISDPIIDLSKCSKSQFNEQVAKKLHSEFRMDGVMINDPEVISSIAGDFEDRSEVVSLMKLKSGEIKGTKDGILLEEEEFSELQSTVNELVDKLCKNMVDGNIDIRPKKIDKDTVCDFCKFKSICRFDTAYPGCRFDSI